MNNRGFAVIESLLALKYIGALVGFLLFVIALMFSRAWIHFSLYEGLICRFEEKPLYECERLCRNRIKTMLPFARVEALTLSRPPGARIAHALAQIKIPIANEYYTHRMSMTDPARQRGR